MLEPPKIQLLDFLYGEWGAILFGISEIACNLETHMIIVNQLIMPQFQVTTA